MFSVIESWHTDAKTGLVDYGAVLWTISMVTRGGDVRVASDRLDEGELANEDARKAFLLNVSTSA